jgi:hypothetical protein
MTSANNANTGSDIESLDTTLDVQSSDPMSAKNVFKRNVMQLATDLGVEPTELAKRSRRFGKGAHRSYMSKLLSPAGELQNFTLDVAESISKVFGRSLHQMVSPNMLAAPLSAAATHQAQQLNEGVFMSCMMTAREVSAKQGIVNNEFENKLTVYLYHAKLNHVAESEMFIEVNRMLRVYGRV